MDYKLAEDIGIKKPGHVIRFLLKLQIDSEILDKNLSVSNINNNDENEINNIMGENSLFDKEYYYMDGKQIRTIKIYFTNLFRKECELNKNSDNLQNKINSDSYCEFVQNQLIRYIKKNSFYI